MRDAPSFGVDLVDKLIVLCGFYGGLRSCELANLKWEDISFAEEGVLMNITFSKTDRASVGSLKLLPKLEEEAICPVSYFKIYKESSCFTEGRLFLHYRDGKFTKSPLGKNTISSVPRKMAFFLSLPNATKYSGHSLRVTSATVLADNGANTLTLKRHGRWTSESVAEEYVRQSKASRCDTAAMLSGVNITSVPNLTSDSKPSVHQAIFFNNCVFNKDVIIDNEKNTQ
jgi:integrase